MKVLLLSIAMAFVGMAIGQSSLSVKPIRYSDYSPIVRFDQFEQLADSVENYRKNRLISAERFAAMSKEENTIILDTRSRALFKQKHVKGAVNLPFADFTQHTLDSVIQDPTKRILIYCNNNFLLDIELNIQDVSFMSKSGGPIGDEMIKFPNDYNFYTMALNIPTFINLVGYGYSNVFELNDLVSTSGIGPIEFEGTAVQPNNNTKMANVVRGSTLVSYKDLQTLIDLVKPHREQRLVNLDEFNALAKQPGTVILDTRSKEMYDAKHVKGAIHLEFSDFTQFQLDSLLQNRNTTILIYCNNNFLSDVQKQEQDRYFMSKVSLHPPSFMTELSLALNIPTYLNLYGYGFQNVYELSEMVWTGDPRIQFEGTSVKR